MSEEKKEASEGAPKTATVDLTNFVPKSEYESLKETISALQSQLTSEDFISFKSAQKTKASGSKSSTEDIERKVNTLYDALANTAAQVELMDARQRNPDFDNFRDAIEDLVKNKDCTFQEAYEQAKAQKILADAKEKKEEKPIEKKEEKAPAKGSEKPGAGLPPIDEKKTYSSRRDADAAVATEFKSKWGLSGDTI